jgi:hypothetical protein
MTKPIVWRPISEDVARIVPPPAPTRHLTPEWFRKAPKFDGHLSSRSDPQALTPTFKACVPFIDAMTAGYCQTTWCDIFIEANGDEYKWRFAGGPEIMGTRSGPKHLPKVQGFNDVEFVWRQVWIPQLPPGYSMLYTHPLNRLDLPFISLTGIIDNDAYYMENVANHPFFIRDGFSGYIPQGTPMFQMIPIKRECWSSDFKDFDVSLTSQFRQVRNHFFDGYKKLFWSKKTYE